MTIHRSNSTHWDQLKQHAQKMPHLKVTDDYITAWTTYKAATTPVDSADERFEKSFQWPPAEWYGSMEDLYKTQQNTPYDAVTFAVLFGRMAKRFPQRVRKFRACQRNWWKILENEEDLTNGWADAG